MAAPVDVASVVSSNGASVTAHVVTLPASIAAGDIIIAQVMMDGASGGFSWPSPWVEVKDATIGASVASITVGWLRASGGETSVTVTSVNAERSTHIAKRITGAHGTSAPEFSTGATGTGTTPNPDSLTASWGAEENLWGAYYGVDTGGPSAYPLTGGQISTGVAVTSAAYGGACSQAMTQATLDPGTFTNTLSDDWFAGTWVVRPAAAGGGSAALAGVVAGVSTLAGDLTPAPAASLAGVVGAISTLSGALTPSPAHALAGVVAAQSGVSGELFEPATPVFPIIPAIGNIKVEIWGPDITNAAEWDTAQWDNAQWVTTTWQDITHVCQNVRWGWGMDDASQGVLGQVAANAFTVYTYDPERELDPSNTETPLLSALRAGNHIQVRFDDGVNAFVLKEGTIDSIAYSIQEQRGQIRVVDRISQMANAKIPAGTVGVPTTLYAAARYLLDLAGLGNQIWVEHDPVTGDIPVGAGLTEEASVWDWLNTLALDAMYGVWVYANDITVPVGSDDLGEGDFIRGGIRSVVAFPNFRDPRDNDLLIGSGTLAGRTGIPIEDIQPVVSREGVFSRIVARDDGAPLTDLIFTDDDSKNKFGIVEYRRERPVPDGATWGAFVLGDRAGAALQYHLGTLRPTSYDDHLERLFFARMLDLTVIRADARDNGDDPLENPLEVVAILVGLSFEANTSTGWSATAVAYVPSPDW